MRETKYKRNTRQCLCGTWNNVGRTNCRTCQRSTKLARQKETDLEALRRIIGDVISVEHCADGMLTLRFMDGTRLAFLCRQDGKLNGVIIQHGEDTPELQLVGETLKP